MRTHVSVRLNEPTMARVDALGHLFSTKWRPATRSDILRALILHSIDAFERGDPTEQKSAKRGGRR